MGGTTPLRVARVGTLADLDKLLPTFVAQQARVEFRDESGNTIGRFVPGDEPICPWEPELIREDLDASSKQ